MAAVQLIQHQSVHASALNLLLRETFTAGGMPRCTPGSSAGAADLPSVPCCCWLTLGPHASCASPPKALQVAVIAQRRQPAIKAHSSRKVAETAKVFELRAASHHAPQLNPANLKLHSLARQGLPKVLLPPLLPGCTTSYKYSRQRILCRSLSALVNDTSTMTAAIPSPTARPSQPQIPLHWPSRGCRRYHWGHCCRTAGPRPDTAHTAARPRAPGCQAARIGRSHCAPAPFAAGARATSLLWAAQQSTYWMLLRLPMALP